MNTITTNVYSTFFKQVEVEELPFIDGCRYHLLELSLRPHNSCRRDPHYAHRSRRHPSNEEVQFFRDNVEYLGHIIHPCKIGVENSHTTSLRQAKPPNHQNRTKVFSSAVYRLAIVHYWHHWYYAFAQPTARKRSSVKVQTRRRSVVQTLRDRTTQAREPKRPNLLPSVVLHSRRQNQIPNCRESIKQTLLRWCGDLNTPSRLTNAVRATPKRMVLFVVVRKAVLSHCY